MSKREEDMFEQGIPENIDEAEAPVVMSEQDSIDRLKIAANNVRKNAQLALVSALSCHFIIPSRDIEMMLPEKCSVEQLCQIAYQRDGSEIMENSKSQHGFWINMVRFLESFQVVFQAFAAEDSELYQESISPTYCRSEALEAVKSGNIDLLSNLYCDEMYEHAAYRAIVEGTSMTTLARIYQNPSPAAARIRDALKADGMMIGDVNVLALTHEQVRKFYYMCSAPFASLPGEVCFGAVKDVFESMAPDEADAAMKWLTNIYSYRDVMEMYGTVVSPERFPQWMQDVIFSNNANHVSEDIVTTFISEKCIKYLEGAMSFNINLILSRISGYDFPNMLKVIVMTQ